MAQGSIQNRGGSYRARFRDPAGVQQSRTFGKKAEADNWLAEQISAAARGEYVDPSAGKVLLSEYAAKWLAMQPHRPSTAAQAKSRLTCHIVPALGSRPIGRIRRSEVQAFVGRMNADLAPSTVEAVYRLLATIMRAAVEDRLIPQTPCRRISLPRVDGRQVEPMQPEQMVRLIEGMTPRYRPAVVAAAGLGLRQGELFGLTVDRVDWLRRTVRVDRQLLAVKAGVPTFGPPKTPASVRTLPAPSIVLEALTEHLREHGEGPERLIFTNTLGSPVARNRAADAWAAAIKRAGIEATGWHDLRHFYASLLIQAGESVKVVQKRLGHKSAVETLDTYGHLWPDSEDATRAAVERFLGPVLSGKCDHPVTTPAVSEA
jgi:integrase